MVFVTLIYACSHCSFNVTNSVATDTTMTRIHS